MLVLKRYVGSTLTITSPSGDSIEIHVNAAGNGSTRLAINAPREYLIVREEAVEQSKRSALAKWIEAGKGSNERTCTDD